MSTIVGAQLENYRILEKLGEGGMGAVYRAVDVMLERDVALKFLRPELAREPDLVERFRTEAVVLARLNHQFIASVYGLHRHNADLFMAMEFVPGETLEHRLQESPRVPADVALHLTSMMLQALEYAHRLGVVHRDIKPANVILRPDGTLKVMDFGIARVLGSERRTRAGTIVGTLGYMAPEQIQGLDIDQRADLYSTGIVLYEMLTGRLPFDAGTDWAMMQAQINEPARAPRDFVASVPEPVERVVLTALEKGPERRFQSASDFQHALEDAARASGFVGVRMADWGGSPSPDLAARLTPAPGVTSWEETRIGGATPAPGGGPAPVNVPPSAAAQPVPPAAHAPAFSPPTPTSPVATPPPADVPAPVAAPVVAAPAASSAVQATPAVSSAPPEAAPRIRVAPPRAPAPPRRRAAPLIGGLALLLAIGAVAAWFVWRAQVGTIEMAEVPATTPPAAAPAVPAAPPPADQAALDPAPPTTEPPPEAGAPASATDSVGPGAAAGTPATTSATAGTGAPTERRRRASPRTEPATAPPQPATGEVATVEPVPPTPAVDAPPEPAPSPPPALPTAIFRDVRLLRPNGPEVDAQLHFEPEALFVRNVGGRQSLSGMRYDGVASVVYRQTRPLRVFVRTTRHWLTLHGKGGEQLRLRLEGETVNAIIATIEQRAGVKVQVARAEEDKEQ